MVLCSNLYQTYFIVFAWSVVASLCIYFDNFVKLRQNCFYIWRQSYKLRCNLRDTWKIVEFERKIVGYKNTISCARACNYFTNIFFISIYSYHFRVIIEYKFIILYLYNSLPWYKWHKTLVYYYRWTNQAEAIYVLFSQSYTVRELELNKKHKWSLTDLIKCWFCIGHGGH